MRFQDRFKQFGPGFLILIWIVALILALRRLDVLWIILGCISFALMLGVLKVRDVPRLKLELIVFLLLLLYVGMSGLSQAFEPLLFGVDIAFVFIAPTIGFMVMFILHHHTKLQVNFYFSLFFVFVFSLASGALLGIGEYLSDQFLGTSFLKSNSDLMVNLVVIAIGSIVMGVLLRNYLKTSQYMSIKSLSSPLQMDVNTGRSEFVRILFSGFGVKSHRWAVFTARLLQVLILGLAVYSIYRGNARWFLSCVLSFFVTMIPTLLTRNLKIVIPPLLDFWIGVALFLHVFGGVMGLYDHVWWWDHVTHFISAALISILGFTVLLTITRLSHSLFVPPKVIPVVIILFILATGVIWEIFEFFCDIVLGTTMQYSLTDTVHDMMFNTVGAVFASILGYRYFLREHWK